MRKRFLCLGFVLASAAAFGQSDSPFQVDTLEEASTLRIGEFSTINNMEPVQVRSLPAAKVQALKNSEDYWYANYEKKEAPRRRSIFDQKWFTDLLWILILAGFIGVVVWYLASSNIGLFRKKAARVAPEAGEGEALHEDIFSLAYEPLIERATASGNYRLAVRLWYLKTLKELSQRGHITYRPDRTDSDYAISLHGTPLYQDFSRLSRHFAYAWYGGFPLSAETYSSLRSDFQTFSNRLGA